MANEEAFGKIKDHNIAREFSREVLKKKPAKEQYRLGANR